LHGAQQRQQQQQARASPAAARRRLSNQKSALLTRPDASVAPFMVAYIPNKHADAGT
jgi:hypothetical protein